MMRLLRTLASWLLFWAIVAYWAFMPTSYWMTIDRIYVANSVEGDPSPQITLGAVIHRDMLLHFTSVLKQSVDGIFITVCALEGTRHEIAGTKFNYDVARFFGNLPCAVNLRAGQYYVDLVVTWSDFSITRSIVVTSNVFTVAPKLAATG